MAQLQRKIADPEVRFISFSIDPEYDTPAILKRYAARWSDDSRWRLLATKRRALHPLMAQLNVFAEKTDDPNDPIDHSTGFLLIDPDGGLRGAYRDDAEGVEQLLTVYALVAREYSKGEAVANATELSGAKLFMTLGCQGCHGDTKIASPLGGLWGRATTLSDDNTVTVDEAYIRESILDPTAKIVKGYPPNMPSYAGHVSDAQLAALVAYLKSLPASGQMTIRQVAVDPVCKMEVSAAADSPHADHAGRTYYFCSEICRKKFLDTPAKFARTPSRE
jgi:YHS domain-containing protein/mono/diheme cytochrome c family protein